MARGSGYGGGAGGTAGDVLGEIQGTTTNLDSSGKNTLRKKYLVTSDSAPTAAPTVTGYNPTNISNTKIFNNTWEMSVDYTKASVGGEDQPTNPVWSVNGVRGQFEMFCSFETKPIELHPRIDILSVTYGGYFTSDGFAKWPPTYVDTKGGGLGGGAPKTNPMFGVTRYKEPTLTLRHTYYEENLPRDIWDNTGKVVTRLPAGLPIPKGDKDKNGKEIPRRWMMQSPAISRDGAAWRVQQEYILLDARGVAGELYEVGQVPGNV